jgi:hypothetical protein
MAAVAAGLLVASLLHPHISDPVRFAAFALTALLASAFRVRIAPLDGTYSLSFLVLLSAVYELEMGELLLVALGSAVVQSYWRAAKRPQLIQVVFNAANVAISVAGAYGLYTLHLWPADWLFLSGGLAALGFYILNTGLTSAVLSLVHGGSLKQVWGHWNFYTLPYYLLGSTLSSAWTFCSRQFHWQEMVVIVLTLYLLFRLLRSFVSTQQASGARCAK